VSYGYGDGDDEAEHAMSRDTVETKVQATLTSISGIGSIDKVYTGLPEPVPDTELPIAVYFLRQPTNTQMTMGGSAGQMSVKYVVDIWILLGPPSMLIQDAEAAQQIYAERMRSGFTALNTTFSGSVFDVDVIDGSDNISTFRDAGEYPQVAFRVMVEEVYARNTPIT
jgi:hypothetical protein